MISTPICALQASCSEMPLHLRNLYLCLNYKTKLLKLPPDSHPGQDIIKDSWQEAYCFTEQDIATLNSLTKSPIFEQITFTLNAPLENPWLMLRAAVDLELIFHVSKNDVPETAKSVTFEYISKTYPFHTIIYTDGSKH